MISFWDIYLRIKNTDFGNAVFITVCFIFGLFVYCVAEGELIEKTSVFATAVIAAAAFRLQNIANKKDKTKSRQGEIISSCKSIKNSFLDTREANSDGNVVFKRINGNGIQALNQENRHIYFEVDFSCNKSTRECTLIATIKNLKSDNYNEYREPYKVVHYISTATTDAVEILNVASSDEYVEETEEYLSLKPLAIGKIGNYEWDEIRSVLANILTSYAMKKENS